LSNLKKSSNKEYRITFRVDKSTYDFINYLALDDKRKISDWVRIAVLNEIDSKIEQGFRLP
jgi:hypothetical protein